MPHNEINQIAVKSRGFERASQSGHVSNSCGVKCRPLEPLQMLFDQQRTRNTGRPVQTGYLPETLPEPRERENERFRGGNPRLLGVWLSSWTLTSSCANSHP
jgi:hypothetical protein